MRKIFESDALVVYTRGSGGILVRRKVVNGPSVIISPVHKGEGLAEGEGLAITPRNGTIFLLMGSVGVITVFVHPENAKKRY